MKHLVDNNHSGDDERILDFDSNYFRRRSMLERIENEQIKDRHAYDLLSCACYNDDMLRNLYSRSPYYD